MGIRTFYLERSEDESGVSGTGKVAEGVELSDGKCILNWLSKISSIAIYPNMKILEEIHGHHGKTKVVFENPNYDEINFLQAAYSRLENENTLLKNKLELEKKHHKIAKKRLGKETRRASRKTAPTITNISPLEQSLNNRNSKNNRNSNGKK